MNPTQITSRAMSPQFFRMDMQYSTEVYLLCKGFKFFKTFVAISFSLTGLKVKNEVVFMIYKEIIKKIFALIFSKKTIESFSTICLVLLIIARYNSTQVSIMLKVYK